MTDRNRIIYLVERYGTKQATTAEENELFEIVNQVGYNNELRHEVTMIFEEIEPEQLSTGMRERILNNVFTPSQSNTMAPASGEESLAPVRRLFSWRWVGAAAALIVLIGTGTYFLFSNAGKTEIAKTDNQNTIKTDVSPAGKKAILTLSDNSTIILDHAANGIITQQGNTKISKLNDGQLTYSPLTDKPTEVLYNTITTPRGGQYNLTLADGSKVWLNAGSSLRFPASFTGRERKVVLTGEAYFEVAKNVTMPFRVNIADKGEVEVLGTHFNINSYADESTINTTLLEGKVKVSAAGNKQLLSPGQQAKLTANGQISLNNNVDIDQVMAWKNGVFNFANADLQLVMRQLARWYDVDIIYEGEIPQREFAGEMQRDLNLSQVLRILEKNNVHFKIEGNKLIVKK